MKRRIHGRGRGARGCASARRLLLTGIGFSLILGSMNLGAAPPAPPPPETEDRIPPPAAVLAELRGLLREGRFGEAEGRARKLLAEIEAAHGPESAETADVLDVLVEALWRGGKPAASETRALAERAVGLRERLPDSGGAGLAASLNNLGIVCSDAGDYAAARSAYERALAIREKELGPEHPDVASVLSNLGVVALQVGDLSAARSLHERALAIREKALGHDHVTVAVSLVSLTRLEQERGDYTAARPLAERALALRERALGPDHPYVAMSRSQLGQILTLIGDYAGARAEYERAARIAEKAFDPGHPAPATILTGYGTLLMAAGDPRSAREVLERALALRERTHAPDHADVAESLTRLGEAHAALSDLGTAEPLYRRALDVWEKAVGPDHPSLAHALHDLGLLLRKRGDAGGAEAALERSLAIRVGALGPDHPAAGESLARLARLRLERGDADRAFGDALKAEEIRRRHVRLTLGSLPERVALAFAALGSRGLDVALAAAARGGGGPRVRLAWDALVRSRAVVLDEMAARHRAGWGAGDPEAVLRAERLAAARTRLANLSVRSALGQEPERYRRLLDEAAREKEDAERALAERSAAFAEDLSRSRIGLPEVEAALPPEGALAAFVRYEHVAPGAPGPAGGSAGDDGPAHYLALILRPGAEPVAAPLGLAREIEDLVGEWRREIDAVRGRVGRGGAALERRYRAVALRLRRAIWDPLEPHLRKARTVFIVPDGTLALVSWGAFPMGERDYLIRSGPALHYLSSERDLVPARASTSPSGRLLALGGPDYGAPEPAGRPGGARPPAAAHPDEAASQEAASGCLDSPATTFAPLPGSATEARMVASFWRKAAAPPGGRETTLLLGREASEGRLKSEASRHAVLHLATHGFFLGAPCTAGSSGDAPQWRGARSLAPDAWQSPLLRMGLALAGANHRAVADGRIPAGEDGILTAEEIASLDLSGVAWAVLSACGSGLGEPRAGEGVLGLGRAFQVAGARSLIISLWDVDDAAARLWIGALYGSRLRGATTAEAAREASLEALRAREDAGVSTHPAFWGAFVASGDWR